MRELVRHTTAVPTAEDFASAIGTPLVVNTDTGGVYIQTDGEAIVPIGMQGGFSRVAITPQLSGFSSDNYITNSAIRLPPTGMAVGMWWQWQLVIAKSAAGVAAPVWQVRIGANQSTADTSYLSLTTSAQTAAADTALITILLNCRSVGASGVIRGSVHILHPLASTGFASTASGFDVVQGSSAGFDNRSLGNQYVGISVNGGTNAAWTLSQSIAHCGIGDT